MAARWRDYLLVTKPGIVAGNLVAAGGGYMLAAGGADRGLIALLAGTGLVIASGCVFNNCMDRRLDTLMARTRGRALAAGRIAVRAAGLYAAALGTAGVLLLLAVHQAAAAACVAGGWLVYVLLYSPLKPRWVHAPLVGAVAGAVPPLAGYLAGGGGADAGAALLAGMFLCWQMPHFYAIAVYRLDDYRAAGIPVLPLRKGVRTAQRHGAVYAVGFFTAAILLHTWGYAGQGYLACVLALALLWSGVTLCARRDGAARSARRLFLCSILSVAVLSVMMGLDAAGSGRVGMPVIDASLAGQH